MKLNSKEICTIRKHLKKARLGSRLLEELLDHYCSQIEQQMNKGFSFEKSVQEMKKIIDNKKMKKLNRTVKIIHFLNPIYMKLSLIVFLFISFWYTASIPSNFNLNYNDKECIDEPIMILQSPTFWPLKYSRHISSSFGMRMHPINKEKKFHRGIDIKARKGSPVFATAEGKVIKISYDDKNGKYIRIQHKEGFISSYMHLSSILIKEGENISGGEVIGKVGNTGVRSEIRVKALLLIYTLRLAKMANM